MISVINRHHTIYIGRGTLLGNPFVRGKDGTREEVIEKYSIWLNEQISNKNRLVCNELNRIYKLSLNYNVYLQCSCKGFHKTCHGDIIKNVLLNKAKNNDKIDLICKDFNEI